MSKAMHSKMHSKITFCMTWIFVINSITSVLCNDIPAPFRAEKKCRDETKACSLSLKCNVGMMVQLPVQGLRGSTGPTGEPGPAGPPGLYGGTGPMGVQGPAGLPGEPGPRGAQGAACEPGERGEKGVKGQRGETGIRGVQGEMGIMGEPGDKGDTGETGPPGPTGLPGARGENGPPGDPGMVGAGGEVGTYGPPGPEGDTGAAGPPGTEGPPGKSHDCRVAFHVSVETLSDYSGIATNTPLVFDTVLLNINNSFNPSTGRFVAPFKGTYSFYVSVGAQDKKMASVIVTHKGRHIATVTADNRVTWGPGSTALILHLKATEDVNFLVGRKAPHLLGSMHTSVSGSCAWRDD